MNRKLSTAPYSFLAAFLFLAPAGLVGCDGDNAGSADRTPGQTDFDTDVPAVGGRGLGQNAGTTGAPTVGGAGAADAAKGAAPSGRTGPVQEADIYKIDQNRLFYLNTYRGFLIYDINDPKNPRQISRLPVYGYPIEMFVQGNTVYALLRDVLYMTEATGKVEFHRHNVSQLVAIDITDIAHPTILKTVDIVGELREGVSRKIDNTIYVVSYIPQAYYWGWRYELPTDPQKEQAWVYSFNVADPRNLRQVQKLKIFEGGSLSDSDPVTGGEVTRYFNSVALSATSNALMVVENWSISSWSPGTGTKTSDPSGCGSYSGDQRAVVSLVDISDPTGVIRLHAHFQTRGELGDQFKQTYVFDDVAKTGTYYGIFARQAWVSAGCGGTSFVQNTLESWDVTNGATPARLDTLEFGKPNETVRGTAFDVTRKAAFAITAQNIDPLYVLSFADRANLTIRSAIDGLSGDMSLFRLVEGNNFLVGIGRDASETCTGFQGTETRRSVGVAVSLIDVRNLDAIRLVQRQCVAVDADWVSSEITWNLDQAHKMIGMHSDGTTNVITIPVSYSKRTTDTDWWWYSWETAVGILSWDLTKYDPTKAPAAQTVIQNYGTFLHPNGEVRRSIVFTHQGATPRRMMINLSDTHVSVADIQDLAKPVAQSVVEVAPYIGQIFQFGDHVVETISESQQYWAPQQGRTEFRIKRAGTDLEGAPVVARFSVSQVQSVIPHGSKLVVFRLEQDLTKATTGESATRILVFDLADPTKPLLVGNTLATGIYYPYYPFFCGLGGGYWFNSYGQNNWTSTSNAIVFLGYTYDNATGQPGAKLTSIDLSDAAKPTVSETTLTPRTNGYFLGLVPDAADPSGLFVTFEDYLEKRPDGSYGKARHYAQRFSPSASGWIADKPVNLPGQLVRTWTHPAGGRAYLTSDYLNYPVTDAQGVINWRSDTRLNLLRASTGTAGQPLAELRSTHRFPNLFVSDLVVDGNSLFVNASPGYYGYGVGIATPTGTGATTAGGTGVATSDVARTTSALTVEEVSDRLVAFDLGKFTLARVYDQPTGTQGVQFMGTYKKQLFVNIQGDGILAVDVANPARPVGRQFLRTLGWATHIVFAGQDAYVAAGYFGVYRMGLGASAGLPTTN